MASVTFENVVKRYGNVTAVSNLNLEIPDKEFLVFVGPSGCGKSTSLRMLAGLEDISEGTIYIGERPVNDVPPKDRDIAMVFQSYALYPHMSVYDNMAFALRLRAKAGPGQRSKSVGDIDPDGVDTVITLCAEEVCPVWLGTARRLHWPLPDPAGSGAGEAEELAGFRRVRDELERRIRRFLVDEGVLAPGEAEA